MADRGIKKVVIPKNSLPELTSQNKHLVRYRIVSEDRNRVSGWSPIFQLDGKQLQAVDGDWSISGRVITLVWGDEEDRPQYDIFVKFDSNEYSYHGTSSIHTYSLISTGTTSFQFAIQVAGISKTRSSALQIYESPVISLV